MFDKKYALRDNNLGVRDNDRLHPEKRFHKPWIDFAALVPGARVSITEPSNGAGKVGIILRKRGLGVMEVKCDGTGETVRVDLHCLRIITPVVQKSLDSPE